LQSKNIPQESPSARKGMHTLPDMAGMAELLVDSMPRTVDSLLMGCSGIRMDSRRSPGFAVVEDMGTGTGREADRGLLGDDAGILEALMVQLEPEAELGASEAGREKARAW
jgi:hypothetical protein